MEEVFDNKATPTGQNLLSQILNLYFYQDTYLRNLKQLCK